MKGSRELGKRDDEIEGWKFCLRTVTELEIESPCMNQVILSIKREGNWSYEIVLKINSKTLRREANQQSKYRKLNGR